jgi:hypothetical protein
VGPEWNDVFAFSRERIQASFLEVHVRGRGFAADEYVGRAGEVMVALWVGTQAEECFPLAVHADAAFAMDAGLAAHIRCKQYAVPRLWYVRVNVIEAATSSSPTRPASAASCSCGRACRRRCSGPRRASPGCPPTGGTRTTSSSRPSGAGLF